jgi:uncharacterized protein YdaU (DUF1376 family)
MKAPAFQFYPGDFLHATTFLSAAAVGSYIRMLSVAWEHGPIPDTPHALAKAMGLGPSDPPFADVWAELQAKWALTPAGWINRKLEAVRADQDAYRARKRTAGQHGAAIRHGRTVAEPVVVLRPCQGKSDDLAWQKPSPSPSPSPSKDQDQERTAQTARFETFWAAYPKHVGKAAAVKAFAALKADDAILGTLLDALARHCRLPQWVKDDGEFVPHPATWLRQRRWEDDVVVPRPRACGPAFADVGGWKDECRALHGGRCGNAHMHAAQMAVSA